MFRRWLRPRLTLRTVGVAIALICVLLFWLMRPRLHEGSRSDSTILHFLRDIPPEREREVYYAVGIPGILPTYRHGEAKAYNTDGQLVEETEWCRGVLHGPHVVWRPTGEMAVRGQWSAGKPHGTWIAWPNYPWVFRSRYPQLANNEVFDDRLFEALFHVEEDKNERIHSEERQYENGQLVNATRYYTSYAHTIKLSGDARICEQSCYGQLLSRHHWKQIANGLYYIPHGRFECPSVYGGDWENGQPVGTWHIGHYSQLYVQGKRRITYRDGHIERVDGEAIEPFTKHLVDSHGQSILRRCQQPATFSMWHDGTELLNQAEEQLGISFIASPSVKDYLAALDKKIENGQFSHGYSFLGHPIQSVGPPVDAILTLWLINNGLTLRHRHECFWLLTNEETKTWNEAPSSLELNVPSNSKLAQVLATQVNVDAGSDVWTLLYTNDLLENGDIQLANPPYTTSFAAKNVSLRAFLNLLSDLDGVHARIENERILLEAPQRSEEPASAPDSELPENPFG